ncbi:monothiol glutaredoxin, Grx4 family [Candidatus Peregrinibacteria bacterium CG10_big_fil_rev_8_21_14_0_10_36_19]|nr:MAG: monothiol glutaredoxin, Grx4 family [Candidatus Peregrinibacteria bacterium CG10_big_fil_rev_8_21_14_0_10_36_19]
MTEEFKKHLESLINQSETVLFMKGDKYLAKCGFSAQVVDVLNHLGVKFTTFDILEDEEVRQGLKEYSNWPTFPQLYHNGELVGGCDIVTEMFQSGELKELLCNK